MYILNEKFQYLKLQLTLVKALSAKKSIKTINYLFNNYYIELA